jgi:hypothetical protein
MNKIHILLALISCISLINCAKRVNITYTVWNGTDCPGLPASIPGKSSNCSTAKLTKFLTLPMSFGEKDVLCANIPSNPSTAKDPTGVIFPHSGTLPKSTQNLTNWEDKINLWCNKTSQLLTLSYFKGLECNASNYLTDFALPLGATVPVFNSSLGAQYNYTQTFDCLIYDDAVTTLPTGSSAYLMSVSAIFFILSLI